MFSRFLSQTWFGLLVFVGSLSVAAQELYVTGHWPGEYPAGVQIIKNVTLKSYRSPTFEKPSDRACTLPQGMILHPWSQKRPQVKFASAWVPQTFIAMTDDSELGILAGEQVMQLSATAEGFCEVIAKGLPYQTTCPVYNESLYQPLGAVVAEPLRQLWVLAPCTSGRSAWVEIMAQPQLGIEIDSDLILESGLLREDELILPSEARERAMTVILNNYSLMDMLLAQKPQYQIHDQKDVFPQGIMITISRRTQAGQELSRDMILVSYDGQILKK